MDVEQTAEPADLEELMRKAKLGTRSYPDVIPELISEVKRLRNKIRGMEIGEATRIAAGWES